MAALSSVNVTVLVSPGCSMTRLNPFNSFTGRSTGDGGGCKYSWATSAPARVPLLRTFTLTVGNATLSPLFTEAGQAKGSGGVGALLRREGLYSSLLTTWRRERDAGVLQALAPQKRGPKSKRDPVAEENQQLRRETQRLTEALRKAEIVIDIQKKVATLLGRPILTAEPEEKP